MEEEGKEKEKKEKMRKLNDLKYKKVKMCHFSPKIKFINEKLFFLNINLYLNFDEHQSISSSRSSSRSRNNSSKAAERSNFPSTRIISLFLFL